MSASMAACWCGRPRDNTRTPPADLKAQFPDHGGGSAALVSAPMQGLLPLIRLGWAMLRPQTP